MKYTATYSTDVGIVKEINQDSLCIKKGEVDGGELLMAVLCDGMGGLSSGELASSSVVMDFNDWFDGLMRDKSQAISLENIRLEWDRLITSVSGRIYAYGKNNGVQLGTTLTAMIFCPDGKYLIAHVGDTRAYKYQSGKLIQLTEDQTFVAREIKMGRMTPEEAKVDKRKNVLLQCVGGEKSVSPVYYDGTINPSEVILLCSDGFRHVVEEDEIIGNLEAVATDGSKDKEMLTKLIELNKTRGERDNITSIIVRTIG